VTKTFDCVPPSIIKYKVPLPILQATADALRRVGEGRKEAVALWQGKILSDTEAQVSKLLIPRQITGPRHFNIPMDERLRIMDEINKVVEFILIQLHTHPKEAFHSEADDRYAVTKHLHAISIVVPDFGMRWAGNLAHASVHLNLGRGVWQTLATGDVARLFEII
jgi:hypothetical protein